jgi:hypothetical protein
MRRSRAPTIRIPAKSGIHAESRGSLPSRAGHILPSDPSVGYRLMPPGP